MRAAGNRSSDQHALLLIDIDDFKKINDSLGHSAGDEVLKALAKLLGSSFRSSDKVARWGGEKFLIFIADVDLQRSWQIADQLCNRVRQKSICHEGNEIFVTISAGLVQFSEAEDFSHLINLADERLYQAKNKGKDQVYCGEHPSSEVLEEIQP